MIEVKDKKIYQTFDGQEFLKEEDAKKHHKELQANRKAVMKYFEVHKEKSRRWGDDHYEVHQVVAVEEADESFALAILTQYLSNQFGFIKRSSYQLDRAEQLCWWGKTDQAFFEYLHEKGTQQVFITHQPIPIEGWPEPTKITSLLEP